ncbi:MAG: hypothetical protein U9Q15_03145 [Patescibacteria group bacterium]|nr:hypothetical protein [Patescibacteria group bacterium]
MSVASLLSQSLPLIFEYLAVSFSVAILIMPVFWVIKKIWNLIT